MPYIEPTIRKILDPEVKALIERLSDHGKIYPGQVNYVISKVIWSLFNLQPSYGRANELIGVLEAIKMEFYRRQVSVYEDEKMKLNGDI